MMSLAIKQQINKVLTNKENKMSKIWTISSKNFEYNDETYEETGGGNVVVAYASQKAAEDKADKLNLEFMRKGCFAEYYAEDVQFNDRVVKFLSDNNLGFTTDDQDDYYACQKALETACTKLSDEKLLELLSLFNSRNYYYVESLELKD